MEPIRSDNPKNGFLNDVRTIANETGAVLIFDEISSGFRLNTGGAHLIFNVNPDIAVFSKALGNGYPIAAIIGKANVMEAAQSSFISSTMWTERIGSTAALATIKKHKSTNTGKHLVNIGKRIQNGWRNKAEECGLKISVGGIPPLSHFAFEYENALAMKSYFVQLMLESGFLASTLFYAMYAHKNEHVDRYLEKTGKVFEKIIEDNGNGSLETKLKGKVAISGFKRLT